MFDFLGWIDLLMGPFWFLVFYFFLKSRQQKKYGNSIPSQKYYARGFLIKAIGAVFVGLIYQYYYGGGDTSFYWKDGRVITSYFFKDINDWWELLTFGKGDYQTSQIVWRIYGISYLKDPNAMTVNQVNSILNFFTFSSYMGNSIFFAFFSFFATWKFYKMLVEIYPSEWDAIGKILFYIPSVMFWGSGIFKDTLTYSCMLLIIYGVYNFFIARRFLVKYIIIILFSTILIAKIRFFFLGLIIPISMMWVIISLSDRLQSIALRRFMFSALLLIAVIVVPVAVSRYMDTSEVFNEDVLLKKAEGFHSWHSAVGGSTYSLGDIDYSAAGIVKKFPVAVNVSLFRPYIWEVHTVFQLISALQSLFFLLFTVWVIYKVKFVLFFKTLLSDSFALYCVLMGVMFAFVTGITSFNFGALDRYKIPALTMYLLGIFLVYVDNKSFTIKRS